MSGILRVVIAEPSSLVADGLRMMLEEAGGFYTVGTVSDGSMLDERLRVWNADLAIINPSLIDGRWARNIKASLPSLQSVRSLAIVYGVFDDELLRQFDAVAKIVDAPASIVGKLRHMASSGADGRTDGGYELTDRERDILMSVARGRTNKEIADEYNISIHTVISHRKNIARKTGIRSVAGLTVYALLNNMIDCHDVE